jgi:hypothetical protein
VVVVADQPVQALTIDRLDGDGARQFEERVQSMSVARHEQPVHTPATGTQRLGDRVAAVQDVRGR